MEINGKEIASHLYDELKERVKNLVSQGITPHLVVVLVGKNPSSVAYVNQKKKWAEFIRAKVTVENYDETVSEEELIKRIEVLNTDPSVHAILIQIPLPPHMAETKLTELVTPRKDIDGFHPDSPFTPPLAKAVITILEEIKKREGERSDVFDWLKTKKIVLLGKGKAGGRPVNQLLSAHGIDHDLIDSKTLYPTEVMQKADIIISAVGKKRIVTAESIKQGAILIGVGMDLGEDGKLFGDYETDEIKEKASYYTPTPGGVGPVNVASLLQNLLLATENQI